MDWNNDGMMDLIFGGGCGTIYYYERLADGSLQSMPNIKSNGSQIDVGFISCPALYDWNGDGLIDLLAGREFYNGGSIRLYPNTGSTGLPSFSGYTAMSSTSGIIQKWRSAPQMGDLDADGLVDLVLAACDTGPFDGVSDGPNWGWVYFYRNIGTNDAPVLADPVQLYGGEELIYNYHHNICLFDWNNDGALDILSGDFNGDIRLYLADPPQGVETPQTGGFLSSVQSPVTDSCVLSFAMDEPGKCRVDIYSTDGRSPSRVLDEVLPAGESVRAVDVSDFPAGAYLVKCTSETGIFECGKVVVLN